MKDERNKMDDLFREGLGDFNPAPPPGLWERIDTTLLPATPTPVVPWIGRRGVQLGLAVLIITGISVLWYFVDNNNTNVQQPEVTSHQEPVINTTSPSTGKQTVLNSGQTERIPESLPITSAVNEKIVDYHDQEIKSVKQTEAQTPFKETYSDLKSTDDFHSTHKNQQDVVEENLMKNQPGVFDLRLDFISWLSMQPAGLNTIPVASPFDYTYKTSGKPGLPRRNRMPVIGGVYASMDWIDYGNGNKKQSMATGVSLSTFKGPWLLETGLAYCLSEDNGRFMISYNSYDSIGYYNKVVSFAPDPNNPGTVQFNTEVQGVYDSIDHELETQTNNRYSYLQIPLMAGYQLYAGRLFTIGLKAGPVFSVMLSSDEPTVAFEQDGTTLNSINNLSPERVSTNWQVTAGLAIGMHLSPRLSLLAEPTYKYYLRPVYQNYNTKPQSFGIKAGLLYRF